MAFPFDTIIDILRAGTNTIAGGVVAARNFLVDSATGQAARISGTGEIRVAETQRVIGTVFGGTILDPNFWTPTIANGGTNTVAGGQCRIATNTTANGAASIESVRTGRYIASVPNAYRGAIQLTTAATANNTRQWGAFDANNGFFFRLAGTTFSIVTRNTTVDTVVSSGSFNGTVTTYTPDTNNHIYEIIYSNARVLFLIDGVLIHTVTGTSAPLAATLTFKASVTNINSGGLTTNVIVDVRSSSIARQGAAQPRPTWKNLTAASTTILKYGPGTLYSMTLNNQSLAIISVALYDATSATNPIINLDIPATSVSTHSFNLDFYTGLTIVNSAGAQSLLVVYD